MKASVKPLSEVGGEVSAYHIFILPQSLRSNLAGSARLLLLHEGLLSSQKYCLVAGEKRAKKPRTLSPQES